MASSVTLPIEVMTLSGVILSKAENVQWMFCSKPAKADIHVSLIVCGAECYDPVKTLENEKSVELQVVNIKVLFGTALRGRRSELGFSQEELADRSGLHRTYISDVERGVRNPSLESIDKLAQALDVSVGELFNGKRKRSR